MNPLDILKKDWKNRGEDFQQFNKVQLGLMLHKRSSNVVRWIFIIGLAEFVFWAILQFMMPKDNYELFEEFGLMKIIKILSVFSYVIIVGFLYVFYKNYKAISVFDDTYTLMQHILRTRQTVKIYVYYNLIMMALSFLVVNLIFYYNPDTLMHFFEERYGKMPENANFMKIFMITQAVIAVLFIGLLWLFYRLIYGILLKKLKKNYKDLQKLVS